MPEIRFNLDTASRGLLVRLQHFMAARHIQAYLVGGLPRDAALGRAARDIDLAVMADAIDIGTELAAELGARPVVLDGANGVIRLVMPPGDIAQVDVSTIQGGSLEADLRRRDLTLNAMAIGLSDLRLEAPGAITLDLIDPLGGLGDIARKQIRAASAEAFREDGIRLLRAVRLAAELGFVIEAETEALIKRDASLIAEEAGERIREELLRLLSLTGSGDTLIYMQQLGLLTAVMPELAPSVGLEQHNDHQWDVFRHSMRSVDALDFLLRRGDWPYADASVRDDAPWNDEIEAHFKQTVSPLSSRRELGKLAAILHDVAKPQTKGTSPSGRMCFYGHPQQGQRLPPPCWKGCASAAAKGSWWKRWCATTCARCR
jgi:poly(A) polymerase